MCRSGVERHDRKEQQHCWSTKESSINFELLSTVCGKGVAIDVQTKQYKHNSCSTTITTVVVLHLAPYQWCSHRVHNAMYTGVKHGTLKMIAGCGHRAWASLPAAAYLYLANLSRVSLSRPRAVVLEGLLLLSPTGDVVCLAMHTRRHDCVLCEAVAFICATAENRMIVQ